MSALDEIFNEGLKEYRAKVAADEERAAELVREREQNELACFREVIRQGLGLSPDISTPSFQIDEFTLSFRSYRAGWVEMRLKFSDQIDNEYNEAAVSAGVNVFNKDTIRLDSREQFLIGLKQATIALRERRVEWERRAASAATPMPMPKVRLDADALNMIWFCKELIDALETGWALTEKQRYVMATIRYTNAIERWTRNDDE